MKIVAKSVNVVEDIKFVDLVPAERRCAFCQYPFKENDEVAILVLTVYGIDEVDFPEDNTYILHINNPVNIGESCLEEFEAKKIISPSAEEAAKSQELLDNAQKSEEITTVVGSLP